jgi:hypothetical protein
MNKIILFAFFLLLPWAIFAQENTINNQSSQQPFQRGGGLARLISMGHNLYIEDPNDLKVNAAYGALYSNFIWGDIGNQKTRWGNDGTSQFMGVNFNLNNAFTVGVILNRNDAISELSISSIDPIYISLDSALLGFKPNNNFEVFSSYKNDGLVFGLGLSYLSAGSKNDIIVNDYDRELSFTQIGINAGIIFQLEKAKIDAAVSFLFPSTERTTSEQTDKASQTLIKIDTRAFIELNKSISIVPLVTFLTGSGKDESTYKSGGSDGYDLPDHTQLLIGAGVQFRNENFLFAGGPSYLLVKATEGAIENSSPELETSVSSIQWNLGAEWYCTEWLTGRLGYKTLTNSITSQTAYSQTQVNEYTYTSYDEGDGFYLGIGFDFGGFSLDATINSDVLRQGLNNIGGGGATLGYISTSYAF